MKLDAETALAYAKRRDPSATQFVVRVYDGFDNCWDDVSEPLTEDAAMKLWNEKTDNGTKSTSYNDIDYYAIYPVTVRMVHSEEGNRDLGIKTIR